MGLINKVWTHKMKKKKKKPKNPISIIWWVVLGTELNYLV